MMVGPPRPPRAPAGDSIAHFPEKLTAKAEWVAPTSRRTANIDFIVFFSRSPLLRFHRDDDPSVTRQRRFPRIGDLGNQVNRIARFRVRRNLYRGDSPLRIVNIHLSLVSSRLPVLPPGVAELVAIGIARAGYAELHGRGRRCLNILRHREIDDR